MKLFRTFFSLSSRSLIIAALALGLTAVALAAWSGPPAGTPPNNCASGTPGCDAPVNVGSSNQIKTGTLTAGGLAAPTITATTQFCINASCISAWPAGGTLGGSGGVNYLSKFITASTLGNSIIYDNGTNVGVGNAAPGAKLDVNGNINVAGGVISGFSAGGQVGNGVSVGYYFDAANLAARTPSGGSLYIQGPGGSGAGNLIVQGNSTMQGSATINNGLTVGNAGGAYTYITLRDDESPNGIKYIHANSNVIGFLSGQGGWLSYWDNNGNQQNTGNINATYFTTTGGAQYQNNGDIYLPYKGQWMSTALAWNGSSYQICYTNGTNCPASSGGIGYGGMFVWNSVYGCSNGGQGNPWSGGCSCPWWAPRQWSAGSATLGGTIQTFFYCTIGG